MSDQDALAELRRIRNERTIKVIDRDKVSSFVKGIISGQDDTIDLIVEQVRNGIAANPKLREGPIGVFMLLGPPGTGKTTLARSLAKGVFENDDSLYVIDMNSCRDEHGAWTYFGSPQGLVGGRGLLTSAISSRRGTGMLILLDEFEKANASVHRMFLSAWSTGFIVDNRDGSQIDTKNTIWMLTSNAATSDVQRAKRNIGGDRDRFNEEMRSILFENPSNPNERTFPPEVLSRISEFFCLDPLIFDENDITAASVGFRLVRNMLVRLAEEYDLVLQEKNIEGTAVAGTINLLTTAFENGGIRALQRWLRRQLASKLVDLKLSGATEIGIIKATMPVGGSLAKLQLNPVRL